MGNVNAKSLLDHSTMDGGGLDPVGIYNATDKDYDARVLRCMILERRLAPFYAGVGEPEDPHCDEQHALRDDGMKPHAATISEKQAGMIVANSAGYKKSTGGKRDTRQDNSQTGRETGEHYSQEQLTTGLVDEDEGPQLPEGVARCASLRHGLRNRCQTSDSSNDRASFMQRIAVQRSTSNSSRHNLLHRRARSLSNSLLWPKNLLLKVRSRQAVQVHEQDSGQVLPKVAECPICFLYYPANINFTRCCHQAICTECFLQIKRSETTLESAKCPYCVQPDFGVVYKPPKTQGKQSDEVPRSPTLSSEMSEENDTSDSPIQPSVRAMSFDADHPKVVSCDALRPHLAQRRKTRERAARRRTMAAVHLQHPSQTSPAPNHVDPRGGRQSLDLEGYLQVVRNSDSTLEDLLLMQAIRLSLMDVRNTDSRAPPAAAEQGTAAAGSNSMEGQPELFGPHPDQQTLHVAQATSSS